GQESCPWMNTATAGGVLGGNVNVTVQHASKNKEDATCEFKLEGPNLAILRIEVATMGSKPGDFAAYRARCGSQPSALRAIGNQAYACSLGSKNTSEQVFGRVRDRAFAVEVNSNLKSATSASVREQARDVAEQVAGNLF
ncbi:MAG: hypothetical protein M3Y72_08115, partial [Acidobacteriota bacterium]|nr:hypothetical protein [Acidobacteriota bacterium]